MRAGKMRHVAGALDDRHLHPEADAEIRHVVFSCIAHGADHALDAAVAEAAGDDDPADAGKHVLDVFVGERFGVDPANGDDGVVGDAGVVQRLDDAQIRVVKLRVFPDERDLDASVGVLLFFDHGAPLAQVGLGRIEAELAADFFVEPFAREHERHFVKRARGGVLNDALGFHVAEKGDLAADLFGDRHVAAANEDVRLDAEAQKLLDRMLRRLGFELVASRDLHDQRDVDIQNVLAPFFRADLANGLEEGLAFDVADGAADLADDDVDVVARHGVDALFDLIGDVGDNLHRRAEIVAAALAVQDRPDDLAGGDRRVARKAFVDEALVMPEIQVRLRAVVGDEHFAVLIRAHRAGIDVVIRVELLVADAQAPLFQKPPERGRADALAEAGHHAARDENEFGRHKNTPPLNLPACKSLLYYLLHFLVRRYFTRIEKRRP